MKTTKRKYSKQDIASYGERIVVHQLQKNGFEILNKNYTIHRISEVDIIAQKDKVMYAIEVKTRRYKRFGRPEHAVNPHKVKKIQRGIQYFIRDNQKYYTHTICIYVVSVLVDTDTNKAYIKWFEYVL